MSYCQESRDYIAQRDRHQSESERRRLPPLPPAYPADSEAEDSATETTYQASCDLVTGTESRGRDPLEEEGEEEQSVLTSLFSEPDIPLGRGRFRPPPPSEGSHTTNAVVRERTGTPPLGRGRSAPATPSKKTRVPTPPSSIEQEQQKGNSATPNKTGLRRTRACRELFKMERNYEEGRVISEPCKGREWVITRAEKKVKWKAPPGEITMPQLEIQRYKTVKGTKVARERRSRMVIPGDQHDLHQHMMYETNEGDFRETMEGYSGARGAPCFDPPYLGGIPKIRFKEGGTFTREGGCELLLQTPRWPRTMIQRGLHKEANKGCLAIARIKGLRPGHEGLAIMRHDANTEGSRKRSSWISSVKATTRKVMHAHVKQEKEGTSAQEEATSAAQDVGAEQPEHFDEVEAVIIGKANLALTVPTDMNCRNGIRRVISEMDERIPAFVDELQPRTGDIVRIFLIDPEGGVSTLYLIFNTDRWDQKCDYALLEEQLGRVSKDASTLSIARMLVPQFQQATTDVDEINFRDVIQLHADHVPDGYLRHPDRGGDGISKREWTVIRNIGI